MTQFAVTLDFDFVCPLWLGCPIEPQRSLIVVFVKLLYLIADQKGVGTQTTLTSYLRAGMHPELSAVATLPNASSDVDRKSKRRAEGHVCEVDLRDDMPNEGAGSSADVEVPRAQSGKKLRTRPSSFTDGQKEWILGNLTRWASSPTSKTLRKIVDDGKRIRMLSDDTNFEGARHVLRQASSQAGAIAKSKMKQSNSSIEATPKLTEIAITLAAVVISHLPYDEA